VNRKIRDKARREEKGEQRQREAETHRERVRTQEEESERKGKTSRRFVVELDSTAVTPACQLLCSSVQRHVPTGQQQPTLFFGFFASTGWSSQVR
jgi:hypothetical protein